MRTNEIPDEVLFRRYAEDGDTDAFTTLYARYHPRIIAFIRKRIQHEADAEDLAGETFLRVVRARGTFDHHQRFSTWIHRIAVNLVYNKSRDRSRRREVFFTDMLSGRSSNGAVSRPLDFAISPSNPETDVHRGEVGAGIAAAIDTLAPMHREVFVMREIKDHPYEEIAAFLGIRVGTVKSRLFRARTRFAEAYRPVPAARPYPPVEPTSKPRRRRSRSGKKG